MTTPVTTLDPRFSDPGADATGWEQTRQVLAEAELFWITTVRAGPAAAQAGYWELAGADEEDCDAVLHACRVRVG